MTKIFSWVLLALLWCGCHSEVATEGALQAATNRASAAASNDDGTHLEQWAKHERALVGFPLVGGNRVDLLVDGPSTYDAMFEAILGAQDHINIETFILADDEVGWTLAQSVADRAREGIVVNVVYDAIGSFGTDQKLFETMEEAGVNVLAFNPLDAEGILNIDHRNHRKILIVDGHIAFTGGINFAEVYAHSSEFSPTREDAKQMAWRDTHLRIEGPVVKHLQDLHTTLWAEQGGDQKLADANYYPQIEPAGTAYVRVAAAHGQRGEASTIYESYIAALRHARERLWITQAYFVPDDRFLFEMGQAAGRGVDVRAIVPGFTDFAIVVHASRGHYSDLLKAGVRIYEYQKSIVHAKTAVVDGVWSTVGSGNLDIMSREENDEANVIVLDEPFGRAMEELFEQDLEDSLEITETAWTERSVVDRTVQWAARWLKPWL